MCAGSLLGELSPVLEGRERPGTESTDSLDLQKLQFRYAVAVDIPERRGQEAGKDDVLPSDDDPWAQQPSAMSLPTPRTLRLLGSELFMQTHFPDRIVSRKFKVGERVQGNWNAFGYW